MLCKKLVWALLFEPAWSMNWLLVLCVASSMAQKALNVSWVHFHCASTTVQSRNGISFPRCPVSSQFHFHRSVAGEWNWSVKRLGRLGKGRLNWEAFKHIFHAFSSWPVEAGQLKKGSFSREVCLNAPPAHLQSWIGFPRHSTVGVYLGKPREGSL